MPGPILENSLFKDPFKAMEAEEEEGGVEARGAAAAAAAVCETQERH